MDMHDINFNEWPRAVNCAITVCDTDGVILYMNERARATFASHGDLIGKNLFCLPLAPIAGKDTPHARHRREQRLATISRGTASRKVIYQTRGAATASWPAWSNQNINGSPRRHAPLHPQTKRVSNTI